MPGYAERALLHGPRQRDELQQQRHVRAGGDTLRSGDSHVDSAVGAVTGFQNSFPEQLRGRLGRVLPQQAQR